MLTGSSSDIASTPGSHAAADHDALPRSVRGAAPELRRLIRKKQNADSARRCRLKVRLDRQREAERNAPPPLADRVEQLTGLLKKIHERLVATELSCAALMERELVSQPTERRESQAATLYTFHQQSTTQSDHASKIYQPHVSQPMHLETEPLEVVAPIPQPCNAVGVKAFPQPLSPTAVTFPAFFDAPDLPFKQLAEIFDEKPSFKQQFYPSSTTDQLALYWQGPHD